jgi:deoxyribonuclease-4
MLLGAHESVAGGAFTAIQRGRDDGCEAIQIFARPSAQWKSRPFGAEEVSLFRSEHASVGWPTMSHASYLINLCATDPIILTRSRAALGEELQRAEELGLDHVVLHPGAHLGSGERDGLAMIAESLRAVLGRARGMKVRLLIEITAGQGSCLGCRFEQLAAILEGAGAAADVGVCVDTCHTHSAGYDLSTEEGYERTFAELDRIVGLDRVKAFHLNDSKTPVGSRVDRHAEIGDGYLGLIPFWRLVNDARFARVPGILETPSGPDKLPSFRRNLDRLRALIGAPRPPGPPKDQTPPDSAKKKVDRQQRLF